MRRAHHLNVGGGLGCTAAVCAAASLLAAPITACAALELHITRVGFPSLRRGQVIRHSAWVPVVVDVALLNEQSFNGSIRIGQPDIDGDECYDRVGVHLRAETGGAQRLCLYTLHNPSNPGAAYGVEVFDAEGETVEVLSGAGVLTYQARPDATFDVIELDAILVLSLSTSAIGRVQDLARVGSNERYTRPVYVGHMSPGELPELWIGLEAVDYIAWDAARPELLTERQVSALLEWVRQGGTLLIAASRTAGALRLSDPLNGVLPVDIGEMAAVENLPYFRRELLGSPALEVELVREDQESRWWLEPFSAPVPTVRCTLRDGAMRIPDRLDNESNLITRRRVGRGHVIFCGVTLADLFSSSGRAADFFEEVFHLPVVGDSDYTRPSPKSLFSSVVSAVAFSAWGSLFLGAAFTFSAVYLLAATFGTWWFLERRRWTHHSWSLFGVVALGASFLSVLSVNFVHGFGETLHQISVLDLDAERGYAYGTVFFGLKTGTDKTLDLWMPSDALSASEPVPTNCFLRPLPLPYDSTEIGPGFSDPEEYGLAAASAALHDVRIRATLKRLEGRWAGAIGGTLTGKVTIKGLEIQEDSYLVNNLGVDLHDCLLVQPDIALTRRPGVRDQSIYVFEIGTVPSDGSRVELASTCYQRDAGQRLSEVLRQRVLRRAQNAWGKELGSVLRGSARGQERNALLLASTLGEYDPQQSEGVTSYYMGLQAWSRDRLGQLDLREQLQPGSVYLLGFADDPGPIRLFRRTGDRPYRKLEPNPRASWTMYRIRIPVTFRRGVAQDEGEEELDRLIEKRQGKVSP